MKVSGFSFIRNAIKYDYPVVEAIRSILPLCDDFVVAVGKSEDNTLSLIKTLDKKVKIVETVWDDHLREGGEVLAVETNKAFQSLPSDSDWGFYIQGDEVVHEKYLDNIHTQMKAFRGNPKVDGLLLRYLHFYGSYDYVGVSSQWYRNEIRIVKNRKDIYSYRDAQGFRKGEKQKLNVKPIHAYVHHYGWVREPKKMKEKEKNFHRYWHDDKWLNKHIVQQEDFDYAGIDALTYFRGEHPKIMQERIARKNWYFEHDMSINSFSLKERVRRFIETITGYRLGEYKNYRII